MQALQPYIAMIQSNRNAQIGVGVAALLIVGLLLFLVFGGGGGKAKGMEDKKLTVEQRKLALVDNPGKAIEIQALLARHAIRLDTEDGGSGKVILKFPEDGTLSQRDRALITLVQSGLMDKNVGLEAFDKGDLTASREEKRIKLIRSQQGELTRLIKKIDPIEDASVNIAIPEQTLFRSEEKPMSASVQVTMPVGTRLGRDKVKAISNLMVGSIQGLEAGHVSISDTNGNTYSSVLDPSTEMDDQLEEQDGYMKQKVSAQLDRLVGTGNYVVTVATELRQAPKETMSQEYDPHGAVVSSKQAFNENLNTNAGPGAGGPASSFLPNSITNSVVTGAPKKDYLRNGVEVSYNNSKTQWVETQPVGMIEDISIAVTIDASHFPQGMNDDDLKVLLARAASPKVRPENVSIAHSEVAAAQPLDHLTDQPDAPPDFSWMYWAGGAVGVCILLIVLLSMGKGGNKALDETFLQTQQELQQLREFASQQQAQLQATQQQTQMILEAQQKQMQAPATPANLDNPVTDTPRQLPQSGGIQQTLAELREVVSDEDLDDDELDLDIKSWIESS